MTERTLFNIVADKGELFRQVILSNVFDQDQAPLLVLAVGAGLRVMQQLIWADVSAAGGPRGRHDPDWTATQPGTMSRRCFSSRC